MAYQALARKYRPQTFEDVIGQEHVVRTLQNAIEQKRIHHAYLFSGVRGIGKTTSARIFAKALNCVKGPTAEPCNVCSICREITEGIDMDVREIDAATYTQVDNIRDLREVTQFQPARDRNRIFIIDEAHMLSTPAWNALLKLIEEPPPHVIFMMATTEMQKVPATILSRVQQFVLRRITRAEVAGRLAQICKAEGIECEQSALDLIAQRGEGSVRDSLSILDQIVSFAGNSVKLADVMSILGLAETSFFTALMDAVHEGDHACILALLQEAAEGGRDFKVLFRDFLGHLRSLLLVASGAADALVNVPADELVRFRESAEKFEYSELLRVLSLLLRDDEIISRSEQQRLAVEIALLKAATLPRLRSVEALLAGQSGKPRVSSPTAPPPARVAGKRAVAPASPESQTVPREDQDLAKEIIDRVRGERKAAASYLDQAKSVRMDESTLTFEYDAADQYVVGYLNDGDNLEVITRCASEVAARPMKARVVSAGAVKPAEADEASSAKEDPILKAFARHLGGEVVSSKKKRADRKEIE